MKRKLLIMGIIILILGAFITCYVGKKIKKNQIEEEMRLTAYRQQNIAFAMDASLWYAGYQGYDKVKEEHLYVCLEVYNSWNTQNNEGKLLLLSDIEDYLSSEYDEDGSFRVTNRPVEIQEYIKWFFDDGNANIEEYWGELEKIAKRYPEATKRMTMEQLQELINKYNDPSYKINVEIMGERE